MNEKETENKSPLKIMIAIAAVVVVAGVIYLMIGKSSASDPTLTQAPPPGPNAVTLQSSPEKLRNGGKMKASLYGPGSQPMQMPK